VSSFVGWFKDSVCQPPSWPLRKVTGASVSVGTAHNGQDWAVDFYDTDTGSKVGSKTIKSADSQITIQIPDFTDSIAFKMHQVPARAARDAGRSQRRQAKAGRGVQALRYFENADIITPA
jgi:hypothetical protein